MPHPYMKLYMNPSYFLFIIPVALFLSACAPQPPQSSPGHLSSHLPAEMTKEEAAKIPPIVQQAPFLPPPSAVEEEERYTVVVERVPLQSFLFALARDAKRNIEIAPGLDGVVTMNALDQTLEQILDRVVRQLDGLRYDIINGDILISHDLPYVHTYMIDYVNLSRESKSTVNVSTQVVTANTIGEQNSGGTDNNSTSEITNNSIHNFWESLVENIRTILESEIKVTETLLSDPAADGEDVPEISERVTTTQRNVVVNKESGLITVRATKRQHAEIKDFLDKVLDSVQRQVLIEATIVEVELSDQYQAGIDWTRIDGNFSYRQQTTVNSSAFTNGPPAYIFSYSNPLSAIGNISATLQLLEQYGNTKVLSSPKIMALNNQTAILKAVDNRVYFSVEVEEREATDNSAARTRFETQINTVPEGLIMSITPQISNKDEVILNVRPTVSRIIDYVADPGLALLSLNNPNLNIPNSLIPVVQVREMESLLRVKSGNVAIIGGLMQDRMKQDKNGIPVLSRLPIVGDAFSYRDDQYIKTELVLFLRPIVIKRASLDGDLRDYRRYLSNPARPERSPPTGLPLNPNMLYPGSSR